MNYTSARVVSKKYQHRQNNYVGNVIKNDNPVIEGGFYQTKPMTVRTMLTRRINKSLCCCLLVTICVTLVSYYIAMNYEAQLNRLDSEIVRINTENQDLQTYLDRFKSFNNVDNKVGEFKLLQKAEKVIEVTAANEAKSAIPAATKSTNNTFNWAIGY